MLYVVAVTLHKRSARAHAHHNHAVFLRLKASAQTVGHKLLGLVGGQSVDGLVYVCTAHAGEHHVLHLCELYFVVVQIFSERSVKRCDRVGGLDADRRNHLSVANANNLRSADTYVYAYYNSHYVLFLCGCKSTNYYWNKRHTNLTYLCGGTLNACLRYPWQASPEMPDLPLLTRNISRFTWRAEQKVVT